MTTNCGWDSAPVRHSLITCLWWVLPACGSAPVPESVCATGSLRCQRNEGPDRGQGAPSFLTSLKGNLRPQLAPVDCARSWNLERAKALEEVAQVEVHLAAVASLSLSTVVAHRGDETRASQLVAWGISVYLTSATPILLAIDPPDAAAVHVELDATEATTGVLASAGDRTRAARLPGAAEHPQEWRRDVITAEAAGLDRNSNKRCSECRERQVSLFRLGTRERLSRFKGNEVSGRAGCTRLIGRNL